MIEHAGSFEDDDGRETNDVEATPYADADPAFAQPVPPEDTQASFDEDDFVPLDIATFRRDVQPSPSIPEDPLPQTDSPEDEDGGEPEGPGGGVAAGGEALISGDAEEELESRAAGGSSPSGLESANKGSEDREALEELPAPAAPKAVSVESQVNAVFKGFEQGPESTDFEPRLNQLWEREQGLEKWPIIVERRQVGDVEVRAAFCARDIEGAENVYAHVADCDAVAIEYAPSGQDEDERRHLGSQVAAKYASPAGDESEVRAALAERVIRRHDFEAAIYYNLVGSDKQTEFVGATKEDLDGKGKELRDAQMTYFVKVGGYTSLDVMRECAAQFIDAQAAYDDAHEAALTRQLTALAEDMQAQEGPKTIGVIADTRYYNAIAKLGEPVDAAASRQNAEKYLETVLHDEHADHAPRFATSRSEGAAQIIDRQIIKDLAISMLMGNKWYAEGVLPVEALANQHRMVLHGTRFISELTDDQIAACMNQLEGVLGRTPRITQEAFGQLHTILRPVLDAFDSRDLLEPGA